MAVNPVSVTPLDKTLVNIYTGDKLYLPLNSSLRAAGGSPSKDWPVCTRLLRGAVREISLGKNTGTLYRGQASLYGVPYRVGDEVKWLAFTSLSSNRAVTDKFAGADGVLIEVEGVTEQNAASVSTLSEYPSEEEVLLSAGCVLRVERREGRVVTLRLLDKPASIPTTQVFHITHSYHTYYNSIYIYHYHHHYY
jgi:hypothetical protein